MSDNATVSISISRTARIALVSFLLLGGVLGAMTGTVAAQDDGDYEEGDPGYALCTTPYLSTVVNWMINLFVYGGIFLGLMGYAGAQLLQSLPFVGTMIGDQVKNWQGNALMSIGKIIFVPAIIIAVLSVTGIGIPDCVSLAFWQG